MMGTSVSTPTVVAKAAPLCKAKETDSYCHGKLEEVGRAYHASRRGDVVGQMPRLAPAIGDGKDEVGLEDEWHGNEYDMERIAENGLTLERKEYDEREQQAGSSVAVELMYEHLLEILLFLSA
jgi:hypothetical protein